MFKIKARPNDSPRNILINTLQTIISLFFNGLGVHLLIQANIGVGPWDVLNIGASKTLGISYGDASIATSLIILFIDILLKEPIGIALIVDALVVGKSVDLIASFGLIKESSSLFVSVIMILIGLVLISYTQYTYMLAALGCGPRDTLMVGLKKRIHALPIGLVSVILLGLVTFSGYLLGGPVGLGTLLCAFAYGPIMQRVFESVDFEADKIVHQQLQDSLKILSGRK